MNLTEVWEKAVYAKNYSEFKAAIAESLSGTPLTVKSNDTYMLVVVPEKTK